jgi:hypothetical protein
MSGTLTSINLKPFLDDAVFDATNSAFLEGQWLGVGFDAFDVSEGLKALDTLIAAIISKSGSATAINQGITTLILVGCIYGPKCLITTSKAWINRLSKKSSAVIKTLMDTSNALGLKEQKPGLSKNELSLGRLMVLLPHVTARIYIWMAKNGHKRSFLKETAEFVTAKTIVPEWMLYPGMIVFCDTQAEFERVRDYMVSVENILPNSKAGSAAQIAESAWRNREAYGPGVLKGFRVKLQGYYNS